MQELKEKILSYLDSQKLKNKRKKDDIYNALGLKTTSDFVMLEKALDELEKDLLVVRGLENVYSNRIQAGYLEGKLSINSRGIGFVDFEDQDSVRIEPEDQMDALDGDTVLVDTRRGIVLQILNHEKKYVVGTYVKERDKIRLVLDDDKLKDRSLGFQGPRFKAVEGLKVLCKIESYGKKLIVSIDRVIGHKDDPGVDIMGILLGRDIDPEFPDEANIQAEDMQDYVSEEEKEGRTDLTGENIVTIDGDTSKDYDDAVGCYRTEDGYVLKVNIADVSHYITEDSPLDLEARSRGCSTYALNTVVPMLPHVISNGICSLNPEVERLTITCEMNVSTDGEIRDYKIYPSVICSKARMTYHDVNEILDGDEYLMEKYAFLGTLFDDLCDCADAIRKKRTKKGAIDFASSETEIELDAFGKPLDVHARELGHAEEIIEDCMIAANVCVANFLKWQEIPAIYRVHDAPKRKKMKDFVTLSEFMGHKYVLAQGPVHATEIQNYLNSVKAEESYPIISTMLLRCMQKAKYSNRCSGHFGLGEDEYLHFTSPIRRYPDLIVHRMLRKYSFEGCESLEERAIDEQKCSEYAESSSLRERESQEAEYACEDYKKAQFMEEHIGEEYEGIITSVTSFGFYVELPNTIEGLVRVHSLDDDFYNYDEELLQFVGEMTGNVYKIGQKVKVTVLSADSSKGTVDFTIGKKVMRPRTNREHRTFEREKRDRQFSRDRGPERKRSFNRDRNSDRGRTANRDRRSDKGRRNERQGKNSRFQSPRNS